MTRQDVVEQDVIRHCRDLEYLVLDELHTYRGRQGGDVALLVRQIRALLAPCGLHCIGTSVTMASGSDEACREAGASVAGSPFGTEVAPTDDIGETLIRATAQDRSADTVKAQLGPAIQAGIASKTAHLDAAFDGGLLAIDKEGHVLLSSRLLKSTTEVLAVHPGCRVRLATGHARYFAWPRQYKFKP